MCPLSWVINLFNYLVQKKKKEDISFLFTCIKSLNRHSSFFICDMIKKFIGSATTTSKVQNPGLI